MNAPFSSRFAAAFALLAVAAPLACGGTTADTASGDASTDGGSSVGEGSVGEASTTCSRSTQLCSGSCVDTMNDSANCGTCGHACGAASSCVMGACAVDADGSVVFAFNKFFFGDTDRMGVSSQTAWKQYGADIDHKTTDRNSTDVCTLASGASKSAQVDGNNGIDNSFGQNILPILLTTAGQDFGKQVNDSINAGRFTDLVKIDRLGTAATYPNLTGAFFGGASLGAAPAWNGNDVWPVDTATVKNGDVGMPNTVFPSSSMSARVWTSGIAGGITLPIVIGGLAFNMHLTQATITMRVDGTNQSAVEGTVSGVVNAEDFIVSMKTVAGRITTSLCQGSAFESIAQQIRQASDIRADGTNVAGFSCDAISVGVGFEAKRVKLGTAVTPPVSPDPCH